MGRTIPEEGGGEHVSRNTLFYDNCKLYREKAWLLLNIVYICNAMRQIRLHIIYVGLLLPFFLFFSCQERRTEAHLLQQADSLMQSRPDSALSLLESINNPETMSRRARAEHALFLTRARSKMHVEQQNDSLIRIAVEYYEGGRYKEREMQSYYYLGCIYRDMRRMDLAVTTFMKALKVIPEQSQNLYLGPIYENLAACYEDQDLFDDAMKTYWKCHEVYHSQKKKKELFYPYRGIAHVFILQNQLDSSLCYYQKAFEVAKAAKNDLWTSAVLGDIARVYNEKKEYKKAYQYVTQSIETTPEGEELFPEYFLKGLILSNLQQLDSARYYLNISKHSPRIYGRAASYNGLYKLEKQDNNFSRAILAVDSFIVLWDSIYDSTKSIEIARLADKYQLDLYQQKLSDRYKMEAVLCLFALIVITVVFLLVDKHRKSRYIALQEQLMRSRADALQGDEEDIENKDCNFRELLIQKQKLCMQLFRVTESHKILSDINKDILAKDSLNAQERQKICDTIYEKFGDTMVVLGLHCSDLTKEDLLYCEFFLLGYSKQTILLCTSVSDGTFKTRKSRIRAKLGKELFDSIFTGCNY